MAPCNLRRRRQHHPPYYLKKTMKTLHRRQNLMSPRCHCDAGHLYPHHYQTNVTGLPPVSHYHNFGCLLVVQLRLVTKILSEPQGRTEPDRPSRPTHQAPHSVRPPGYYALQSGHQFTILPISSSSTSKFSRQYSSSHSSLSPSQTSAMFQWSPRNPVGPYAPEPLASTQSLMRHFRASLFCTALLRN